MGLRVESNASPLVERKMALAGVVAESFAKAEIYLCELADLDISGQRIRRITRRRGRERLQIREQVTAYYRGLSIPDQLHRVPDGIGVPSIAVVSLDGGRYQEFDRCGEASPRNTKRANGTTRKGSHWKESRVACVMSMEGPTHEVDPMPELPVFLAGGTQLQRKLSEIGRVMALPGPATEEEEQWHEQEALDKCSPRRSRERSLTLAERPLPGPQLVHRNCMASAMCWRDFGVAVAAEAWSQGFAGAERKVCICDGNDAIRRVCKSQFSDYIHVLDLMHALGYSMNASRGVGGTREEINARYRRWAELIWKGRVDEVIKQLDEHQRSLGEAPTDAPSDDPREAIRAARVYYQNQQSRMNYPRYRQLGLPLTSSLMESSVKQLNRRVKGTEKFWSPNGGDEMLTLRGDFISDGNRLSNFLAQFAHPTDGIRSYGCAG